MRNGQKAGAPGGAQWCRVMQGGGGWCRVALGGVGESAVAQEVLSPGQRLPAYATHLSWQTHLAC